MSRIKELAIKYFVKGEQKKCTCGGAHEVCLDCAVCRTKMPDAVAKDFNNLAQYIDHTALKSDTKKKMIVQLCQEAVENKFMSVCINPGFVKTANNKLKDESPLVCTVVGFPLGANLPKIKAAEAVAAIKQGAKEVDMVINVSLLKDKSVTALYKDVLAVANACRKHNALLKVIIEICLLTEDEIIIACLASKKAGADFVKTSTGFSTGGATLEAVALMRKVVGNKIGVKAAGGVSNGDDAKAMLKAGANRIGTSKGVAIIKGQTSNSGY